MFANDRLFGAGLQSSRELAILDRKHEESPRSSVMLTPVSEDSSVEMVTLSPPQISPFSQLSETASDTSAPEITEVTEVTKVISLSIKSSSLCDASATNGELHADDNKEPKRSKAHLHCPVCKVTMNSVSQLDAHNSGTSVTRHRHVHKMFSKAFYICR